MSGPRRHLAPLPAIKAKVVPSAAPGRRLCRRHAYIRKKAVAGCHGPSGYSYWLAGNSTLACWGVKGEVDNFADLPASGGAAPAEAIIAVPADDTVIVRRLDKAVERITAWYVREMGATSRICRPALGVN